MPFPLEASPNHYYHWTPTGQYPQFPSAAHHIPPAASHDLNGYLDKPSQKRTALGTQVYLPNYGMKYRSSNPSRGFQGRHPQKPRPIVDQLHNQPVTKKFSPPEGEIAPKSIPTIHASEFPPLTGQKDEEKAPGTVTHNSWASESDYRRALKKPQLADYLTNNKFKYSEKSGINTQLPGSPAAPKASTPSLYEPTNDGKAQQKNFQKPEFPVKDRATASRIDQGSVSQDNLKEFPPLRSIPVPVGHTAELPPLDNKYHYLEALMQQKQPHEELDQSSLLQKHSAEYPPLKSIPVPVGPTAELQPLDNKFHYLEALRRQKQPHEELDQAPMLQKDSSEYPPLMSLPTGPKAEPRPGDNSYLEALKHQAPLRENLSQTSLFPNTSEEYQLLSNMPVGSKSYVPSVQEAAKSSPVKQVVEEFNDSRKVALKEGGNSEPFPPDSLNGLPPSSNQSAPVAWSHVASQPPHLIKGPNPAVQTVTLDTTQALKHTPTGHQDNFPNDTKSYASAVKKGSIRKKLVVLGKFFEMKSTPLKAGPPAGSTFGGAVNVNPTQPWESLSTVHKEPISTAQPVTTDPKSSLKRVENENKGLTSDDDPYISQLNKVLPAADENIQRPVSSKETSKAVPFSLWGIPSAGPALGKPTTLDPNLSPESISTSIKEPMSVVQPLASESNQPLKIEETEHQGSSIDKQAQPPAVNKIPEYVKKLRNGILRQILRNECFPLSKIPQAQSKLDTNNERNVSSAKLLNLLYLPLSESLSGGPIADKEVASNEKTYLSALISQPEQFFKTRAFVSLKEHLNMPSFRLSEDPPAGSNACEAQASVPDQILETELNGPNPQDPVADDLNESLKIANPAPGPDAQESESLEPNPFSFEREPREHGIDNWNYQYQHIHNILSQIATNSEITEEELEDILPKELEDLLPKELIDILDSPSM
ncbi:hypothetical protein PtA15_15A320 [Puccinia triticina]|uniref:Uncharacterized protein n=1 Tax=Puccinia triticina TaxID=208348 RepID=A0ABY7D5H1_9BASI|nr:uncharacterized protein PtA15_15A320 [Puccinia triticina]WAQ91927.1 hypothetical protein PtA15_15A320 [Puccinia triticina]